MGGAWSRFRLGDGWNTESVAGGILREEELQDYMGPGAKREWDRALG